METIPLHNIRASRHVLRHLCVGCDTLARRLDVDRLCPRCARGLRADTFSRLQNGEIVYRVGELTRCR